MANVKCNYTDLFQPLFYTVFGIHKAKEKQNGGKLTQDDYNEYVNQITELAEEFENSDFIRDKFISLIEDPGTVKGGQDPSNNNKPPVDPQDGSNKPNDTNGSNGSNDADESKKQPGNLPNVSTTSTTNEKNNKYFEVVNLFDELQDSSETFELGSYYIGNTNGKKLLEKDFKQKMIQFAIVDTTTKDWEWIVNVNDDPTHIGCSTLNSKIYELQLGLVYDLEQACNMPSDRTISYISDLENGYTNFLERTYNVLHTFKNKLDEGVKFDTDIYNKYQMLLNFNNLLRTLTPFIQIKEGYEHMDTFDKYIFVGSKAHHFKNIITGKNADFASASEQVDDLTKIILEILPEWNENGPIQGTGIFLSGFYSTMCNLKSALTSGLLDKYINYSKKYKKEDKLRLHDAIKSYKNQINMDLETIIDIYIDYVSDNTYDGEYKSYLKEKLLGIRNGIFQKNTPTEIQNVLKGIFIKTIPVSYRIYNYNVSEGTFKGNNLDPHVYNVQYLFIRDIANGAITSLMDNKLHTDLLNKKYGDFKINTQSGPMGTISTATFTRESNQKMNLIVDNDYNVTLTFENVNESNQEKFFKDVVEDVLSYMVPEEYNICIPADYTNFKESPLVKDFGALITYILKASGKNNNIKNDYNGIYLLTEIRQIANNMAKRLGVINGSELKNVVKSPSGNNLPAFQLCCLNHRFDEILDDASSNANSIYKNNVFVKNRNLLGKSVLRYEIAVNEEKKHTTELSTKELLQTAIFHDMFEPYFKNESEIYFQYQTFADKSSHALKGIKLDELIKYGKDGDHISVRDVMAKYVNAKSEEDVAEANRMMLDILYYFRSEKVNQTAENILNDYTAVFGDIFFGDNLLERLKTLDKFLFLHDEKFIRNAFAEYNKNNPEGQIQLAEEIHFSILDKHLRVNETIYHWVDLIQNRNKFDARFEEQFEYFKTYLTGDSYYSKLIVNKDLHGVYDKVFDLYAQSIWKDNIHSATGELELVKNNIALPIVHAYFYLSNLFNNELTGFTTGEDWSHPNKNKDLAGSKKLGGSQFKSINLQMSNFDLKLSLTIDKGLLLNGTVSGELVTVPNYEIANLLSSMRFRQYLDNEERMAHIQMLLDNKYDGELLQSIKNHKVKDNAVVFEELDKIQDEIDFAFFESNLGYKNYLLGYKDFTFADNKLNRVIDRIKNDSFYSVSEEETWDFNDHVEAIAYLSTSVIGMPSGRNYPSDRPINKDIYTSTDRVFVDVYNDFDKSNSINRAITAIKNYATIFTIENDENNEYEGELIKNLKRVGAQASERSIIDDNGDIHTFYEWSILDLFKDYTEWSDKFYQYSEASRLIARGKRAVIYGATMHPFIMNLERGTAEHINIAVVNDINGSTFNLMGEQKDNNDTWDGSGLQLQIQSRLENNSLLEARVGDNKKTILGGVDGTIGSQQLLKWAVFAMTNEVRRNLGSRIKAENITKKCMSKQIPDDNINKLQSIYEEYSKNGNLIYFKNINDSNIYKITNIQINGREATRTVVNTQNGNAITETFTINNLYDIDQLFGGAWSGKLIAGEFEYTDAQNDILEEFICNNKLKDYFIAYVVNKSAMKTGVANLNETSSFYDDTEFKTMKMTTRYGGVQMDADHELDMAEVTEMTQMISALIGRGYYTEEVMNIYTEIGRIVASKMNGMRTDLSNDDKTNLYRRLAESLIRAFSTGNKDTIGLAQAFLKNVQTSLTKKDQFAFKLPFSAATINGAFISDVASSINRSAIRRKMPGFAGVLNPSYDMIQYYNLTYKKNGRIVRAQGMFEDIVKIFVENNWDYNFASKMFKNGQQNPFAEELSSPYQIELEDTIAIVNERNETVKTVIVDDFFKYDELVHTALPNNYKLYRITSAPRNLAQGYTKFKIDGDETEYKEFDLDSVRASLYINKYISSKNSDIKLYNTALQIYQSIFGNDGVTDANKMLIKLQNYTKDTFKAFDEKTPFYFAGKNVVIKTSWFKPHEIISGRYQWEKLGITDGDSEIDITSPAFFENKLKNKYNLNNTDNCDIKMFIGEEEYLIRLGEDASTEGTMPDKDFVINENITGDNVLYNGEYICSSEGLTFLINKQLSKGGKRQHVIIVKSQDAFKDLMDSKIFDNIYRINYSTSDKNKLINEYLKLNPKNNGKTLTKKSDLETWEKNRFDKRINAVASDRYEAYKQLHYMIGARIPTQEMQSFMAMKVVATTRNKQNQIYVPRVQTWLQGSDYDIDKLYIMSFDLSKSGRLSYGSSAESASDLTYQIIKDLDTPNGITYKDTIIRDGDPKPGPDVLIVTSAEIDAFYNDTIDSKVKSDLLNKIYKHGENVVFEENVNVNQFVNTLNSHSTTKDKIYHSNSALRNRMMRGILNTMMSSQNRFYSTVPINMDNQQAAASTSTLGAVEKTLTADNPATIFLMQTQNMVGKEVIGITAVCLKTYFSLATYYNNKIEEIIKVFNDNINSDNNTWTSIMADVESEILITDSIRNTKTALANIRIDKIVNWLKTYRNQLYENGVKDIDFYINFWSQREIECNTNNCGLEISGLLSAATDNAKELILAKINATPELADIYGYLLMLNWTFEEIAGLMTSPGFNFAIELCKENVFDKNSFGFSVKKSLGFILGDFPMMTKDQRTVLMQQLVAWADTYVEEFGQNDDILQAAYTAANNKDWEKKMNAAKWLTTQSDYLEFVKRQLIKSLNEHVNENENYDDLAQGVMWKILSMDSRKKIISIIEKMIDRNNFFKEHPFGEEEKIMKIAQITENVETMSLLGAMLGINQGVKTNMYDQFSFISRIDRHFTETFDTGRHFNWLNENLSELSERHSADVFPIFSVLQNSPHFKEMFTTTQDLHKALSKLSAKYRTIHTIFNKMTKTEKKKTINGVEVFLPAFEYMDRDVFNEINRFVDMSLISNFLLSRNFEFHYPKDLPIFIGRNVKSETNADSILTFKNVYDINSFKLLMDNYIIPMLKSGTLVDRNGNKTNEDSLKNNAFIKSLLFNKTSDSDGNITSYYRLPFDMYTIKDSNALTQRYDEILKDFKDLDTMHFDGYSVIDLFYLYNMIVHKDGYGRYALTTLFEDLVGDTEKTPILNDYNQYISELDYSDELVDLNIEFLKKERIPRYVKSQRKGKVLEQLNNYLFDVAFDDNNVSLSQVNKKVDDYLKEQQQTITEYNNAKELRDLLIAEMEDYEGNRSAVKDGIAEIVKGRSYEEVIENQKSFFTEPERLQIKKALNGKNLRVASMSRHTDPIFFANDIIRLLKENYKKPFTDPTRINAIEIWTKHDGVPLQSILEACKMYKVAPMVSFSITTLGDTAIEKGVLRYKDLLSKIENLILDGSLNPATTTIRIDPILPGYTNMEDVKEVVKISKGLGFKKFVTSLMQSYGYSQDIVKVKKTQNGKYKGYQTFDLGKETDVKKIREMLPANFQNATIGLATNDRNGSLVFTDANGQIIKFDEINKTGVDYKDPKDGDVKLFFEYNDRKTIKSISTLTNNTYDWGEYYGYGKDGKVNFLPKQKYIDEIGKTLLEINQDPEISLETCSFTIRGLKGSACLDPLIIERLVGGAFDSDGKSYIRDKSRKECYCYGVHGGIPEFDSKACLSNCGYCYKGHGAIKDGMKYYTENGELIDKPETRTGLLESESYILQSETFSTKHKEFNKLPKYTGKTMTYAGIGSRDKVPGDILKKMTLVAELLEEMGYTLNSGGANGSDKAFENGVEKAKQIFYATDATDKVRAIAAEIHPNWSALKSQAVQDLMARNTYQIFGKNLDTPVDFVLYYAIPDPNNPIRPKGGTGQAVEMANRKGIPTINMYDVGWEMKLAQLLFENNKQVSKKQELYDKSFVNILKGAMTFNYDENARPGITAKSTFDAILNGERTATTRYANNGNTAYWSVLKKNDIVEFTKYPYVRQFWNKTAGIKLSIDGFIDYAFIEEAKNNPNQNYLIEHTSDNNAVKTQFMEYFATNLERIPSNIYFSEDLANIYNKNVQKRLFVRITKPLTRLDSSIYTPGSKAVEEWSKKEGWSVEYFEEEVRPKLKDGAYQFEYELINSDDVINVTSTDKDYKHLSNFAPRKFTVTYTNGETITFDSVEQAFQYEKTFYLKEGTSLNDMQKHRDAILKEKNSYKIKQYGGQLPLNTEAWNAVSDEKLYQFMKLSFIQNDAARQALLETKDKVILHRYENGTDMDSRFGKMLMQIRYELSKSSEPKQSEVNENNKVVLNDATIYNLLVADLDNKVSFSELKDIVRTYKYDTLDVDLRNYGLSDDVINQARQVRSFIHKGVIYLASDSSKGVRMHELVHYLVAQMKFREMSSGKPGTYYKLMEWLNGVGDANRKEEIICEIWEQYFDKTRSDAPLSEELEKLFNKETKKWLCSTILSYDFKNDMPNGWSANQTQLEDLIKLLQDIFDTQTLESLPVHQSQKLKTLKHKLQEKGELTLECK